MLPNDRWEKGSENPDEVNVIRLDTKQLLNFIYEKKT